MRRLIAIVGLIVVVIAGCTAPPAQGGGADATPASAPSSTPFNRYDY